VIWVQPYGKLLKQDMGFDCVINMEGHSGIFKILKMGLCVHPSRVLLLTGSCMKLSKASMQVSTLTLSCALVTS
jgi:hypothetical protein